MKSNAIRRRVLPFTPLVLMLEEPGGGNYRLELKLAFDMNAGAAIQERTADPKMNFGGYMLTDFGMWRHISEPRLLKAMLWGAMLAHQPEYDSDEGFSAVGTYIQESNAEEIVNAVEKAYYAYLPKHRVDAIEKLKANVETKGAGAETQSPLDETPAAEKQKAGSSSGRSPAMTSASV